MFITSLTFIGLLINPAFASGSPCVTGDAPAAFTASGVTCDTPGGVDICMGLTGGKWVCNLGLGGNTSNGVGYLVHDYGLDRYSSWGTDGGGRTYCCAVDDDNVTALELLGGGMNDQLSFVYTDPSTLASWQADHSGERVSHRR